MARAKNKVIASDYKGKLVGGSLGSPFISLALTKFVYLDHSTVESVVPSMTTTRSALQVRRCAVS